MTPHRSNKRGSFVIDRWSKHVGRIALASGTTNPRVFAKMNELITDRLEVGDYRTLARLKARKFTPMQFYLAGKKGDWSALSTDELHSPLLAALLAFVGDTKQRIPAEHSASDHHLSNYRSALRHLEKQAIADTRITELPDVVRTLKPTMQNEQRMYNVVRSLALTFASEKFGQESSLYRAVAAVKRYKVTGRRINHPASVRELRDIAAAMEKVHPGAGLMVWTLATTGMRPKEYWADWTIPAFDHVRIVSAKSRQTGMEVRLAPLVTLTVLPEPARPTCWRGKFAKLLATASSGQMQPYDLRRTYANWTEDARWDTTRFRLYFGHGARNTTDIYRWRDVKPHLVSDAVQFAAWIEARLEEAEKVIPITGQKDA